MGTSKIQKQVDDKPGKCIAVTAVHFHFCAVYGVFGAVMVGAGEEGGCTQVAAPVVDFHPAKLEKALDLARISMFNMVRPPLILHCWCRRSGI